MLTRIIAYAAIAGGTTAYAVWVSRPPRAEPIYTSITRADIAAYEAVHAERPLVAMRLPPTFAVIHGELRRLDTGEVMLCEEPLAEGRYAVIDGPTWFARDDEEIPIPADSRTLIVVSRYELARENDAITIHAANADGLNNQPNPSRHCICRAFCTLGCAVIDPAARTCYCLSMQPEGENMPPQNINCRKSACNPRLPGEGSWW